MIAIVTHLCVVLFIATVIGILFRPSIVVGAQLFGTALFSVGLSSVGVGLGMTYVIFGLSLFAVAVHYMRGDNARWYPYTTVEIVLLLFLFYAAITLAWTPAPSYGKEKVLQMIGIALPCLMVSRLFAEAPLRLRKFLEVLGYYSSAIAVLTFLYIFSGVALGTRFRSEFMGPLQVGYGAVGLVSFASYLLLRRKLGIVRLMAIATCALGVIIIVGSGSRGAALAMVIASLCTFLRGKMLFRTLAGFGVAAAVVFVVVYYFGDEAGLERLMGRSKQGYESGSGRFILYEAGLNQFLSSPIRGDGIGGFANFYGGTDIRLYPHNSIIEVAGETGVIGLLLFGFAIACCFRQIFRIRKFTGRGTSHPLYWELCVAQFVFFTGLVNSSFSFDLPSQRLLFAGMGMLAGISAWKSLDEKRLAWQLGSKSKKNRMRYPTMPRQLHSR